VQYVGLRREGASYRYKLIFNTADGSECFTACHVTPSYLDGVKETFKTGNCVVLLYEFVKRFFNTDRSLILETEIFYENTTCI
jgi:hypothetical protein